MPTLDFWFDFASTYSYPAAMRIAPAGGRGRRDRALSAVPAGADLQGPGLGHLAVQRLRGQGPPHVARPRAAVRRPGAAVPAPGAVPAVEPAGGAGGAGRARRRLGRGFLPGGVPGRVRRRPPHRRRGGDRRHPRGAETSIRRRFSTPRRPKATSSDCVSRPTTRSGSESSARRPSSPAMANCSGATTGWSARCAGCGTDVRACPLWAIARCWERRLLAKVNDWLSLWFAYSDTGKIGAEMISDPARARGRDLSS